MDSVNYVIEGDRIVQRVAGGESLPVSLEESVLMMNRYANSMSGSEAVAGFAIWWSSYAERGERGCKVEMTQEKMKLMAWAVRAFCDANGLLGPREGSDSRLMFPEVPASAEGEE